MNIITLLQGGFWVCLALTVILLILTIVFFFVFNIPLIFNVRTGRAKKKTIEQMKKKNSETGRLKPSVQGVSAKLNSVTHDFNAAWSEASVNVTYTDEPTPDKREAAPVFSITAPSEDKPFEYAETGILNIPDGLDETVPLSAVENGEPETLK